MKLRAFGSGALTAGILGGLVLLAAMGACVLLATVFELATRHEVDPRGRFGRERP